MRILLRALGVVVASLVLLASATWFGGRAYLKRSVAQYEGTARANGLGAEVDVYFDTFGVPQVFAKTDADARFTLGWMHAGERLFQMELTRRMARGELSEIFGAAASDLDAQQRRLGFRWQNARDIGSLSATTRANIEQYLAGVNAWIAQAAPLPPEFVLLGFKPRPWTVEDVSIVGLYQSWFALTLMDKGADYREVFAKLGGDANRLANAVQAWSPPVLPMTNVAPKMTKASNSWAVMPAHTVSGAALHASDPHLELSSAPVLWYAIGLHSAEGLEAVGVSAPGLPSISMGHNAHASWAFTVAPLDLVDDYKEMIRDAESGSPMVQVAGGWEPVLVQAETIHVKGAEPRIERVLRTARGPVLSMQGDTALVMHWAGYDFPAWSVVSGTDSLMRVTDFEMFRRTVTRTGALSVNWTYADRAGNIGYQLGAPIPIRDGYDTFTPQWGTDARAAWRGYRPLAERPFLLNPAQGWLATTNDQVVGARSAFPLPGYYNVTRKTRIAAILDSALRAGKVDAGSMTRAQRDLVSGNAVRWRALASSAAKSAGNVAAARALREWDGRMSVDDTVATLWSYWWTRLPRELFEDDLGADWPKAGSLTVAVLSDSAHPFADDIRTSEQESLDAIATRAMRSALAEDWQRPFMAMQTLTVRHPLAMIGILDEWLGLTRGPYPIGGDDATLDAAFSSFDPTTRTLHDEAGPSMRFVMDWSDLDSFTLAHHLGQSGNPLSPHFSDLMLPHLAGEAWPMPWSRAKVEARALSRLTLTPGR